MPSYENMEGPPEEKQYEHNKCPTCGSGIVMFQSSTLPTRDGKVYVAAKCNECNARWTIRYVYDNVDNIMCTIKYEFKYDDKDKTIEVKKVKGV